MLVLGLKMGIIGEADAAAMAEDIDRQTAVENQRLAKDFLARNDAIQEARRNSLAGIAEEVAKGHKELSTLRGEAARKANSAAELLGKGIQRGREAQARLRG